MNIFTVSVDDMLIVFSLSLSLSLKICLDIGASEEKNINPDQRDLEIGEQV